MDTKTVVVRKDGVKGVVIKDSFANCGLNEIAVVYEGKTSSLSTNIDELDVIGPENAVVDTEKCGADKGEERCIFMVMSSNGSKCERFGSLRHDLIFQKDQITANREPTELFPNCQL